MQYCTPSRVRSGDFGDVLEIGMHLVGPARAIDHERLSARDPDEPGGKLRIAPKAVGMAPDLVERVHQHFLGPRVVAQHVERVGVDPLAERLVQLAKRRLVFAADAYEQLVDLVVVHAG
jgi:hypothetical protein